MTTEPLFVGRLFVFYLLRVVTEGELIEVIVWKQVELFFFIFFGLWGVADVLFEVWVELHVNHIKQCRDQMSETETDITIQFRNINK